MTVPSHNRASISRSSVLRSGAVFDGVADELRGPTEILVIDGVIAEIGDVVPRPDGAEVIDLTDRTVSPGFIDCHVHTQLTPDRLLAIYNLESSAMKALNALPVLEEILRAGFTTVRDAASLDVSFSTVDLKKAVDRGIITGPRMLVCPHMFSGTGGHGEVCVLDPEFHQASAGIFDGVDAIRGAIRAEILGGADWIKVSLSGFLGGRAGDGPEDLSWTQAEIDTAVSTARDFNVDTCVHALGDESVQRALNSGARSIEHASLATDETLARFAELGTYLVPTMHMVRLFAGGEVVSVTGGPVDEDSASRPDFGLFARLEELREGQKRIAESDATIAFGSDSGGFPHADAWKEFTAMVASGIAPARALRSATSVAADLLRRPDLGRIAVGNTADIVAMPGNPLQDIEATGRVDFVMKEGRIHHRVERPSSATV